MSSVGLQLADVLDRFQNLPGTFKRGGPNYATLENTLAAAAARFTNGINGIAQQLNFNSAEFGWLNVWGELFSIQRQIGETDSDYRARITQTLLDARGTPIAIQTFMFQNYGDATLVTENFSQVLWSIIMPSTIPSSQYTAVIQSLKYVRPAGVPFSVSINTGGMYIGTSYYIGQQKAAGSYIGSGSSEFGNSLSPTTNNTIPVIPTAYLTDSILTGQLHD